MSIRSVVARALPGPVAARLRFHLHAIRARRLYGGESMLAAVRGHVAARLRPRLTILFYPQAPWFPHVMFKLCAVSGYRMITDPSKPHDVAFKREGATFFDPELLAVVPGDRERIVNARSTDISKRRVAEVFLTVFGYPLAVDPTTHEGSMVEKSDMNARKDGRILEGPIPASEVKEGSVYQRLIDTRTNDGREVVDHRVPLYRGRCPLVYVKHRVLKNRFMHWNTKVEIHEPTAVLDAGELDRLARLVEALGIDYGEVDVLRDRDGRIYVVDANNTPAGPPNGLTAEQRIDAMRRLRRAFSEFLEEWRSGRPRSVEAVG